MNPNETLPGRRPRVDDRPIRDLDNLLSYVAVLVAYDLGLFRLLAGGPRTSGEVCAALGLAPRAAEALLASCGSLGFVEPGGERYRLTPVAEEYLLEESPFFAGGSLDLAIAHFQPLYSFESLKRAVVTNEPQAYSGTAWVSAHAESEELAYDFTRMMHGLGAGPATVWPQAFDLSSHRLMLDVGGGSGVHAVAATRAWPGLRAVVLDIPSVCAFAAEYATEAAGRVRVLAADMWDDPFPPADLHFFSDVFHDWSPERCAVLARKSFESLEPGGRVLVHEILYDDDKQGPATVAACALAMLLWTEGQQFSGAEICAILGAAGFVDLEVKPTFGYWSLVSGRKG